MKNITARNTLKQITGGCAYKTDTAIIFQNVAATAPLTTAGTCTFNGAVVFGTGSSTVSNMQWMCYGVTTSTIPSGTPFATVVGYIAAISPMRSVAAGTTIVYEDGPLGLVWTAGFSAITSLSTLTVANFVPGTC